MRRDGLAHRIHKRRLAIEDESLPRLGNRKERRKEEPRPVLVVGTDLRRHARQDLTLTRRIVDRRPALALRRRNLCNDVETLQEKLDELLVNLVNLTTDILDIDHKLDSLAQRRTYLNTRTRVRRTTGVFSAGPRKLKKAKRK